MNGQITLKKNHICVYVVDIKEFLTHELTTHILKSRKNRIGSYIKPEDKARCLIAGLLERFVLGINSDDDIVYGVNKKPYLKNNTIFYNLSHSGEYVTLCVSNNESGIDIEYISGRYEDIAKMYFTKEEYIMVSQGDGNTFFRIWTAKESIMKATGQGLLLSPETFTVLPLDEKEHTILGEKWYFRWLTFNNHIICVAVKKYFPEVDYKFLDKQDMTSLINKNNKFRM